MSVDDPEAADGQQELGCTSQERCEAMTLQVDDACGLPMRGS
jgi:hypothetical protein